MGHPVSSCHPFPQQGGRTVVKVLAPGGVHHWTSPRRFSVQEYAYNLCRAEYIVSVYHPEKSDLVPPPGWTIVMVSGHYYHLSPNADLGFVRGGGGVLRLRAERRPSHHTAPKL